MADTEHTCNDYHQFSCAWEYQRKGSVIRLIPANPKVGVPVATALFLALLFHLAESFQFVLLAGLTRSAHSSSIVCAFLASIMAISFLPSLLKSSPRRPALLSQAQVANTFVPFIAC